MRQPRPTRAERLAYHAFSLIVVAAGLWKLVELMGAGAIFLGAAQ